MARWGTNHRTARDFFPPRIPRLEILDGRRTPHRSALRLGPQPEPGTDRWAYGRAAHSTPRAAFPSPWAQALPAGQCTPLHCTPGKAWKGSAPPTVYHCHRPECEPHQFQGLKRKGMRTPLELCWWINPPPRNSPGLVWPAAANTPQVQCDPTWNTACTPRPDLSPYCNVSRRYCPEPRSPHLYVHRLFGLWTPQPPPSLSQLMLALSVCCISSLGPLLCPFSPIARSFYEYPPLSEEQEVLLFPSNLEFWYCSRKGGRGVLDYRL